MTDSFKAELPLVEATPMLSVIPAPSRDQEPEHIRAAIRCCRAAWQRAYKAEMVKSNGNDGDDVFATFYGGWAYRKAMPILSNHDSIQAFIACAAHGILIGAIAPEESGQILYAAQAALGALNFGSKSRKLASS